MHVHEIGARGMIALGLGKADAHRILDEIRWNMIPSPVVKQRQGPQPLPDDEQRQRGPPLLDGKEDGTPEQGQKLGTSKTVQAHDTAPAPGERNWQGTDEERRLDVDGWAFTKQEFIDGYDGTAEWDAAPLAPGGKSKPMQLGNETPTCPVELQPMQVGKTRNDAGDTSFTERQFLDGTSQQTTTDDVCSIDRRVSVEKRLDVDGLACTKQEFIDGYDGTAEWDVAPRASTREEIQMGKEHCTSVLPVASSHGSPDIPNMQRQRGLPLHDGQGCKLPQSFNHFSGSIWAGRLS
eukprot:gene57353-biopygen16489